jgi:hypothetical protein
MSTPYAGTEGFSGTDTSRDRAESKAATAKRRQNQMLAYLARRGRDGATVVDVKRDAGPDAAPEFAHHGTASGTLSILHRSGQIARLTETRDKAHVYVLPEHIDGRGFERFIGNATKAQIAALDDAVRDLEALRPHARAADRLGLDVAAHRLRSRIERLAAGDDL